MSASNEHHYTESKLSLQSLDLFEPIDDSNKRYPLVIYIHGGGWVDRDKKDYAHMGPTLVEHKICCAIINYQLSPSKIPDDDSEHLKHPVHTIDCANAFKWLAQNASGHKFDINNVYVIGHSAGGFMAAALLYDSNIRSNWISCSPRLNIRCCFGLQGLYDLTTLVKDFPSYVDIMIAPGFGKNEQDWHEASPTTLLQSNPTRPVDPKWVIIWSSSDELVNETQGINFEKALKEANIECEHVVLEIPAPEGTHNGVTQDSGFAKVLPLILKNIVYL